MVFIGIDQSYTSTGYCVVDQDVIDFGTIKTDPSDLIYRRAGNSADNIIELNKGQVGSGVSAGKAGLTIDRGDEPDYQMVFDEVDDMFKVGMNGQLQTIASQNYVQTYASPVSHSHNSVTNIVPGFMSSADKIKLDSVLTSDDTYTKAQVAALISAAVTDLQSQMYSHG